MTEGYSTEPNSKKRARDDSGLDPNSSESKRVNSVSELDFNSVDSMLAVHDSVPSLTESYRVDLDLELVNSVVMKHIPENILDILDDSETVPGRDSSIQDLDSVIKSFEEEILHSSSSFPQPQTATVLELTSDSQPDVRYLLEASDDELGLPPTTSSSDEEKASNEPIDQTFTNTPNAILLGNMIEFEPEFPSYDSFEFGIGEVPAVANNNVHVNNKSNVICGDFVTVDGIFDYSEPSDFSGLIWRPEDTLPAL